MSYRDNRKEIQAYFQTNFTGVPRAKVAWDNVSYTPITGEAWVRLSIQHTISDMVSTGGPSVKVRRFGLLFVQIFVPEGGGTDLAEQIADNVADILEAKQLPSGLTFQESTKREIGNNNGWYQYNVSTPFYYDEQRSTT